MLGSPPAGNAAAARAKAMYGKRLRHAQYQELCSLHSVAEIVSYLNEQTTYAAVLADVKGMTVHRGALEQMLYRKIAGDFEKLCGFDTRIDRLLRTYYHQQVEIRCIVRWLRAKTEEEDDAWFLSASVGVAHSDLDPVRMNACKTVAELKCELQETPYAPVLSKFAEDPALPTVTELENALMSARYTLLTDAIQQTDHDSRAALTALLDCQRDAQNFCRIWRLKRYYHLSPEEIRRYLLPHGMQLTGRQMEDMLYAADAKAAAALFFDTPFGRRIPPAERRNIDMLPERLPYLTARKNIYFSAEAPVICLAYVILAQTELHNLIHIIEGIRYAIPAADILKLLILDDPKGG